MVRGWCVRASDGDHLVFSTLAWNDPFSPPTSGNVLLGLLLFVLPLVAALVLSVAAVVVRFGRSVGEERLQLKWFAAAAARLVVATFIASFFSSSSNPPAPAVVVLQSLAFLFLWVAIAIAVLKYRLYEIDVVISKAVVYGVAGRVHHARLRRAGRRRRHAGREPAQPAAARRSRPRSVAVAFQPVRERAERLANRVVYGKRATPYEVLSDFAERDRAARTRPRTCCRGWRRSLAEGTGAAERRGVAAGRRRAARRRPRRPVEPTPSALRARPATSSPTFPDATPVVAGRAPGRAARRALGHEAAGRAAHPDRGASCSPTWPRRRLVLRQRPADRGAAGVAPAAGRRRRTRRAGGWSATSTTAPSSSWSRWRSSSPGRALVGEDPSKARERSSTQLRRTRPDALENLRDLARGIYPPLLADQGLAAALEARPASRRSR